jgi:hypothetical protein
LGFNLLRKYIGWEDGGPHRMRRVLR